MQEQSKHKIEARFGLSMPKIPYTNLSFDYIDGCEFFLKEKATFKTTCFDLIVALPFYRNILVKKLSMPPK